MSSEQDSSIRDAIEGLIYAENEGKGEIAGKYLSSDFIAITRSTGIEENRDRLMNAIDTSDKKITTKGTNGKKIRELAKEHFRVLYHNTIAISRSLVTVKEEGEEDTFFRNIHVFSNKDGKWLCNLWQVTKLVRNEGTGNYEIVD